ncbi:hypothetical protein [Clostridium butyricum]|uniref:hypothetical protein n=1 Tax=Clostridium butyricum TaxID=1492 RepID=UPI00055BE564|nr:hypothetical protein [Clostridium butyricum]
MSIIVKEVYSVKVCLAKPKQKYDLTQPCDGINIKQTFWEAIRKYNVHKSRRNDGASIFDVKITNNEILFKLQINPGHMKKMGNTIGNSLSQWLFHDLNWQTLSLNSNSHEKHTLFNVYSSKILN